ncbi:uncharacterized protein LOC121372395 [Gigantopelta aegis]|uniref:uncharacterized protein LOC121372395 n=1 Tax=Gigantopelta aegis TaxID=1735272 RepID=UPI001B88C4E7|nr:uncharacterized protein LOC121372395 [Gigantopelta aegis]
MDAEEHYCEFLIASVIKCLIPHTMAEKKEKIVLKIMKKIIKKSLSWVSIRMQKDTEMCVKLIEQAEDEKEYHEISHKFEYLEDYLMQSFRERSHHLVYSQTAENNEPTCTHQQAINRCYSSLVKDLHPTGDILDELVQHKAMSITSMESILARPTPRARNEEFILRLKAYNYETFNTCFMPALQKHQPHVAQQLRAEMTMSYETAPTKCLPCRIREEVQVKRLAESLLKAHIIRLPAYSDYKSLSIINSGKWSELLKTIHSVDIINALENKYKDLYTECQSTGLKTLECVCFTEHDKNQSESGCDVAKLDDFSSCPSIDEVNAEDDSSLTESSPSAEDPDKTQRSVDSELRSKRRVKVFAERKNTGSSSEKCSRLGKKPLMKHRSVSEKVACINDEVYCLSAPEKCSRLGKRPLMKHRSVSEKVACINDEVYCLSAPEKCSRLGKKPLMKHRSVSEKVACRNDEVYCLFAPEKCSCLGKKPLMKHRSVLKKVACINDEVYCLSAPEKCSRLGKKPLMKHRSVSEKVQCINDEVYCLSAPEKCSRLGKKPLMKHRSVSEKVACINDEVYCLFAPEKCSRLGKKPLMKHHSVSEQVACIIDENDCLSAPKRMKY